MSTAELKEEAKALIVAMNATQLRAASAFLAFVRTSPIDAATRELLSLPDFRKSFTRGHRDIQSGRVKPWR